VSNDFTFGLRMKELRLKHGLTQPELAEMTGTTVRTISRLETGVQTPTFPIVLSIAKALGTDCRAFAEAKPDDPTQPEKPKMGRPRKEPAEEQPPEANKPRGRPKKNSE
jgi:transcriptional regulator with XRE-family HTH domain